MKMSTGQRMLGLAVASVALVAGGAVFAEDLGQPAPWEFRLQESASPVMDSVASFHSYLSVLITVITLFVLGLLAVVVVKFNAKSNPVPSRTTHNTALEVAWTLIPVMILVGIAIPSFRLLFLELDVPEGRPHHQGDRQAVVLELRLSRQRQVRIRFADCDEDKQPRLLGVDNELVVPVNKVVRVQTTGTDVIHSFAVPAFGIKIDAIPGRVNETWFKATKTGMFYGQCSELCGKDHAFMPIAVRVVTDQEFAAWVEAAKKKFAHAPANSLRLGGAARRSRPEACAHRRTRATGPARSDKGRKAGSENGNERSDTRRSRP